MRIVEEVLELLPEHIPEGLLASARDEAAKRFGPRAPAWSGSVTWKAFKHALRASLRTIGTSYAQETEMAISHAEFAHNRERVAALDNVFSKQLVVGQAEATLRLVGAGPDELKKGLLAAAIRFEQLKPHLSPFSRVGRTRGSLYEAPSHETAAKAAHWEGVTKPQLELVRVHVVGALHDALLGALYGALARRPAWHVPLRPAMQGVCPHPPCAPCAHAPAILRCLCARVCPCLLGSRRFCTTCSVRRATSCCAPHCSSIKRCSARWKVPIQPC